MNYYSLTGKMNYCTQIREGLQSTDYTDFIHGFSGAGRYSLWSAHVETRRATSPRGKHKAPLPPSRGFCDCIASCVAVIANAVKQSSLNAPFLDCFVALAMTRRCTIQPKPPCPPQGGSGDANIQLYNNCITTYNNRITMYGDANKQLYNNFITTL